MIIYDGRKLMQTIIMTEENTAKLYKNLSEKVDNKYAKNIFIRLSEDEENHIKLYSEILEKLPQNGRLELTEDEVEYTELLISSNIFSNEKLLKRYLESDALLLTEKIERDAILFNMQLAKLFPDTVNNDMELVLKQEKNHLKAVLDSQLNKIFSVLGL
ncbi:MAG: ferritin family protein [Clostridiaceae bacterium]